MLVVDAHCLGPRTTAMSSRNRSTYPLAIGMVSSISGIAVSQFRRQPRGSRWNPETDLPEGPIPLLGGENMMSHRLDISEATLQRVGGSNAVVPAMLHASSTAWTAPHRAPSPQQEVRPSAPASGSRRRRISATLRAEASSRRPERRIASARPAGLAPMPVPSAGRSMPPESWSGRARSPRRAPVAPLPSIGVGMPDAAAPTTGSRYSGPR